MMIRPALSAKFAAEWGGCISGLIGAALLALHLPYSGWGFVFFLVSNAFWITFAALTRAKGLALMQLGFTVTSAIGTFNWLLK